MFRRAPKSFRQCQPLIFRISGTKIEANSTERTKGVVRAEKAEPKRKEDKRAVQNPKVFFLE